MYRTIRNLHLMLGLACCFFLLMYSVSAVEMSHNDWFDMEPTVEETRATVNAAAASSPRALAQELMRSHGLRGSIERASIENGGYAILIKRLGTEVEVSYARGAPEADVKTSRSNRMEMLHRMHHVNGLYHEDTLMQVWGVFVGLISAAILALGCTGVYMWFKVYDERLVGGLILLAGLSAGLGLLVAMRLQI